MRPLSWGEPAERSPARSEAIIVPSIRELLNAFEDPESRSEILARIRAGDPELEKSWGAVTRMFQGLGEKAGAVRPALRDAVLGMFDSTAESARQLLLAARVPAPATALRGSPHTRFHELFEVDGHEIDLAWMDDEMLVGQVVPPDPAASMRGGACVLYGGTAPRQVALEEMGEFEIAAVSPGSYELAIETSDRLVVVPELELVAR